MPLHLSDADVRLVQDAQRALFPSEDRTTNDAWTEAAFPALCRLLQTDHVHYTEPRRPAAARSLGEEQPSSPVTPPLRVRSTADEAPLARALNNHFTGFSAEGFSQFRDPYMTMVRGLVRGAGAGAFHDGPLHDADRLAQSALHQAAFRPRRVQRKMALSVPLHTGEAMLVVGFTEANAPAFDGRRHHLFKLLLPAFESALRYRLLLAGRPAHAPTRLDLFIHQAPIPLLFYDLDGAERYRNRAFCRLVDARAGRAAAPPAALPAAAQALALRVLRGLRGTAGAPQPTTACMHDAFWLRACPGVVVRGQQGIIVFVERAGRALPEAGPAAILPSAARLEAATALTPREAEVARHVAEGKTDRAIAEHFGLSPHTIRRHTSSILDKLDVAARGGVALALLRACSSS